MIFEKLYKWICSHHVIIIDWILILLIGMLPLFWFKDKLLINVGDFDFPLNPLYAFSNYFYVWGDSAPGTLTSLALLQIPYQGAIAASSFIGIPLWLSEALIYYVFLFFASGISMYFLCNTINNGINRIFSISSSIFYMMNFFSLTVVWHYPLMIPFFYAALPLFLALSIKILNNDKSKNFYIILFCLIWFIFLPMTNPKYILLIWIVISFYTIFYICINISNWKAVKQTIYSFFSILFLWILINAWWILPMIELSSTLHKGIMVSSSGFEGENYGLKILEINSHRSSVINVLRLDGFTNFPYYFSFAKIYNSSYFIFIGFLVPIMAFIPILLTRKYEVLFFTTMAIIGIFLTKAVNPPLADIYLWAFNSVPMAGIFRSTFDSFGGLIALSYAYLIGFTLHNVYTIAQGKNIILSISKRKIRGLIFVILLLVQINGVYMWPFWTGDIIEQTSYIMEVPEYYKDANYWLNNQSGDFNILSLPLPSSFYVKYSWEHGYSGANTDVRLFSRPIIARYTGQSYEVPLYLSNNLINHKENNLTNALNILNIKYILIHNDVDLDNLAKAEPYASTPQQYQLYLNAKSGIRLVRSFGQLDIYRNEQWKPLHIYPAKHPIIINGSIDEMFQVVNSDIFSAGDNAVFLINKLNQEQIQFIKEYNNPVLSTFENSPEITFQEINPTKYKIYVNASYPFFLIFSESYHPMWKVNIDNTPSEFNPFGDISDLFGKSLNEKNHLIVNGYANAWYINPHDLGTGQNFTINLYFKPQSYFYIGLIISGFTFIGCFGYLFWDWKRKYRTRSD